MSDFVHDGDFSVASAVSPRRWSAPFFDNKLYVFDQDFAQALEDWAPLQLDAQDPEEPSFYLVAETQPETIGGGIGRWTRTYARRPEQRSNYETYNFRYPGIETLTFTIGGITTVLSQGREPFDQTVISRIQYDYFHPGVQRTIAAPTAIPIIEGFMVTQGGRGFPADYLTSSTNPTVADYWSRTRNYRQSSPATPFSHVGITAVDTGNEICVEDSHVSVWMGNIYERVTRFVPVL